MKYLRVSCLALACFIGSASASFDDHFVPERIQTVEQDLAKKNVSKESVDAILEKSHYDQSVIDKINKPFEDMPWWRYQERLVNKKRVKQGVEYWHQHEASLNQAQEKYGVSPSILVAIIGIESNFGNFKATHSALDALATLGLSDHRRHDFSV